MAVRLGAFRGVYYGLIMSEAKNTAAAAGSNDEVRQKCISHVEQERHRDRASSRHIRFPPYFFFFCLHFLTDMQRSSAHFGVFIIISLK